jgi:hypothetical protein
MRRGSPPWRRRDAAAHRQLDRHPAVTSNAPRATLFAPTGPAQAAPADTSSKDPSTSERNLTTRDFGSIGCRWASSAVDTLDVAIRKFSKCRGDQHHKDCPGVTPRIIDTPTPTGKVSVEWPIGQTVATSIEIWPRIVRLYTSCRLSSSVASGSRHGLRTFRLSHCVHLPVCLTKRCISYEWATHRSSRPCAAHSVWRGEARDEG